MPKQKKTRVVLRKKVHVQQPLNDLVRPQQLWDQEMMFAGADKTAASAL